MSAKYEVETNACCKISNFYDQYSVADRKLLELKFKQSISYAKKSDTMVWVCWNW